MDFLYLLTGALEERKRNKPRRKAIRHQRRMNVLRVVSPRAYAHQETLYARQRARRNMSPWQRMLAMGNAEFICFGIFVTIIAIPFIVAATIVGLPAYLVFLFFYIRAILWR